MSEPRTTLNAFQQQLESWQKKFQTTQATRAQLQTKQVLTQSLARRELEERRQASRKIGLPTPSGLLAIKETAVAEKKITGIQSELDTLQKESLNNLFYSDLYSTVPALTMSGAVNTVDEALSLLAVPPDLPIDELESVRNEIAQLLQSRNANVPTIEDEIPELLPESEADVEPLAPPAKLPTATSIHQLSTQAILKSLTVPKAPQTTMSTEEWREYLKSQDWSDEDIDAELGVTTEKLIAEAQNRKNMIEAFQAEGYKLPKLTQLDYIKMSIINPPLVALEAMGIYFEHVSMPAAGWLYSRFIPDVKASVDQYINTHPEGGRMADAYTYAWKQWDAPGPPVIDFVLKYMLMEGLVDPLSFAGWGIVTKGLRGLGPAGRALATGNAFVGEVLELPFDFIKWGANSFLPKTIRQTATMYSRNSESVVKVAFEKFSNKPLYQMTPKEMKDAGEFVLAHLAKNPRAEDDLALAARELLVHPPVTKKESSNWIARLKKTGAKALPVDQVTDRTLLNIDEIFERVFTHQTQPVEEAGALLKVLGVMDGSDDAYLLAERVLGDRANNIISQALDFAAANTNRQALSALSRKQSKIYEAIASSSSQIEARKAGRFALFAHNVEKGYVGSWAHYINRYVVRSAADSYLTFGGYGFGNAGEDIWRSILGGVKPGRVSVDDYDAVMVGLLADPTLRSRGLSEMVGRLREVDESSWHNWLLTFSTLWAGVPTYLVSRGKITPKRVGEKAFELMVEMPGAFSADVRRNFKIGKMRQILADTGGDTYKALIDAVPKSLPPELSSAPKWVKRNLVRDARLYAETGKLNSDNPTLINQLKDRYTHDKIVKAEIDDILGKYPEISPSTRSVAAREFKEFMKSPDTIEAFGKRAYSEELDDFIRSPEKAIVDFEKLTDYLTQLGVQNPQDMADLIAGIYRMTVTYGALPDQIIARATVKSRGLPVEARKLQFDLESDRIAEFLDKAGANIDTVVEKIRTSSPDDATQRYLDLVTSARKVISDAKSQDIAFRQGFFAEAGSRQMRTNEFWNEFYASEMSHWKSVSKKMAVINSQLHQAIEEINTVRLPRDAKGRFIKGRVTPRQPVKLAPGEELSPSHVAKLMQARGDDLSRMLLDTLIPEGDKDYFVEYIMGMVRGDDVGFTRESVGRVYDQIAASMQIDPASSSWFRVRQIQLESMTKDLHDLYNAKLFPKEQKEAVDKYIDETVQNVTKVTREAAIPDYDIGLGEMITPSGKHTVLDREYLDKIRTELTEAASAVRLKTRSIEFVVDDMASDSKIVTILGSFDDRIKTGADLRAMPRDELSELLKIAQQESPGLEGISPKLNSLIKEYQTSGYNTLKDTVDSWFRSSDNESLQILGKVASDTPEYLAKVRGILREKYPSGYIRIYRGSGKAKGQFIEREYTNITSSRKTALDFEDTWVSEKGVPTAEKEMFGEFVLGEKPTLDNILIKVDDVVSIGSVDESELIIPVKILKDRIDNPLPVPLTERLDFQNYDNLRQMASDEADRWYYKEYTDYSNSNMLDAMMTQFFPFWRYESQRWFWLPRSFIRRPGTLAAWGRWQDNTDSGYIHIPGTSIDVNPARGTVYGPWSTRLMRKDYPEYYDELEGMGGMIGFFDWISRYGFYPNIIYGFAVAQFGGRQEQIGGILPSIAATPLNALIGIFPDNKLVEFISERVFAEPFRNYLTARAVDDLGGDGSLLFAKKRGAVALTPEEEAMWTQARRTTTFHSAAFEQFGFARMRSDKSYELAQASAQFIEENWGITVEQQEELRRRGEKLWDVIGGLDPWETAVLQELEFFKYSGSVNPVLPGRQQEILNRIELDWADVMSYSENMRNEVLLLQQDFLIGSERGRLAPDDFLLRVRDLYRKRREYIDEKTKANPLMLLENRTDYYKKYGQLMPVQSPYNELMDLFFSVELEDTVDPGTGERILDWDKFWANREMIDSAIPEEDRGQWDAFLSRHTAPMMQVWQDAYTTYMKKYYGLWDKMLSTYSDDEQRLINEYLFLERTGQQLERQEAIKTLVSEKDGKQLISSFRSSVSNEREALRYANPMLDAQLFYWGRVKSFKTSKAEQVYRQLAKSTGRRID